LFFKINETKSKEELGYLIFKPLNEGNISKAIVAQRLAYNLEKGSYKQEILNSPELSYLRNAIYNVTKAI
jgi:hypothetical protein